MTRKIFNNIKVMFLLSMRDLKERYVSSYLGIMWAFVQPVVTLAVMWVVFSMGFKAMSVSEVPFILWLMPGYLAWQYFAEGVQGATQSIVASSYLVKKIVFSVELLPVVKIVTALMIHLFFLLVMIVVYSVEGYAPRLHNLQLLYYLVSVTVLMVGISYITSSVTVFTRDIGQVVSMMLQIGFWATPIFWHIGMIPSEYHWLIELNPVNYIVSGYRASLLGGELPDMRLSAEYWLETLLLLKVGQKVYRQLRPHFADVL